MLEAGDRKEAENFGGEAGGTGKRGIGKEPWEPGTGEWTDTLTGKWRMNIGKGHR